jgi:hypothetical protein
MIVFEVVPKPPRTTPQYVLRRVHPMTESVPPTAPKSSINLKVKDSIQKIHIPREYMEVGILRMPVAKLTVHLSQYLYLSSGM